MEIGTPGGFTRPSSPPFFRDRELSGRRVGILKPGGIGGIFGGSVWAPANPARANIRRNRISHLQMLGNAGSLSRLAQQDPN